MSRQVLAIDIRHQSIAAVLLSAGLKSTSIVACHRVPIDTAEENEKALASALATLTQQFSMTTPDVVVGLPADQAIYRNLQVPFKEEKKIRQVLPFELEPNLPVPVDRLVIDYIATDDTGVGTLLTAAIDRQHVDDTIEALGTVGLRPQLIVPGDFPLASTILSFGDQVPDQAFFLSLDTDTATLFLLDRKKITLARSMVANHIMGSGPDNLASKIRQTLIAYAEGAADGFHPDILYIGGPASADPSVVERLAAAMEMQLQPVDLQHMTSIVDTDAVTGQWSAPLMDGALALAMVEIERLPCPVFHRTGSTLRNYWTAYRQYVRVPAILLAVVLLLGLSGVLIENHLLQKQADSLDRQIEEIFKETFPQSRRVGDAADQMRSELKKQRTGSIDVAEDVPQVNTIDILMQLSRSIPKEIDVLFTRLVLGGDGLTLSGETTAFNVVDEIKNGLEQNGMFQAVTIASANMEKSGSKVRFILKLTL